MGFFFIVSFVGTFCAVVAAADGPNLVVNGDFAGSFTGWTVPSNGGSDLLTNPGNKQSCYSGSTCAVLGASCSTPDMFCQTIATTVGSSYLVSFYYNIAAGGTSELSATFASAQQAVAAPNSLFGAQQKSVGTWTLFQSVDVATSSAMNLCFTGCDGGSYVLVDLASVQLVTGTSSVTVGSDPVASQSATPQAAAAPVAPVVVNNNVGTAPGASPAAIGGGVGGGVGGGCLLAIIGSIVAYLKKCCPGQSGGRCDCTCECCPCSGCREPPKPPNQLPDRFAGVPYTMTPTTSAYSRYSYEGRDYSYSAV